MSIAAYSSIMRPTLSAGLASVTQIGARAAKERLQSLVKGLTPPVDYAFGYGSGVFSQGPKASRKRPQIDLILGVKDTRAWHKLNMERNPHHYSCLRYLGSKCAALVQDRLGAGVYFNPFVKAGDELVKYGVVSLDVLRHDLKNWQTLYLAGRLHKPVQILVDNEEVARAQERNLIGALSVALLLLPEQFSEKELYMRLAGVSYMGDVRMAIAENPNKVVNIVENQFEHLRKLYHPLWHRVGIDSPVNEEINDNVGPQSRGLPLRQSMLRMHRLELLGNLPSAFRARLNEDDVLDDYKSRQRVAAAVRQTVKWPSLTQSFKGILTAGIVRSANYSLEKLIKRWR